MRKMAEQAGHGLDQKGTLYERRAFMLFCIMCHAMTETIFFRFVREADYRRVMGLRLFGRGTLRNRK